MGCERLKWNQFIDIYSLISDFFSLHGNGNVRNCKILWTNTVTCLVFGFIRSTRENSLGFLCCQNISNLQKNGEIMPSWLSELMNLIGWSERVLANLIVAGETEQGPSCYLLFLICKLYLSVSTSVCVSHTDSVQMCLWITKRGVWVIININRQGRYCSIF